MLSDIHLVTFKNNPSTWSIDKLIIGGDQKVLLWESYRNVWLCSLYFEYQSNGNIGGPPEYGWESRNIGGISENVGCFKRIWAPYDYTLFQAIFERTTI